jgi:transcriptional regulator with XRE-family HTH domain
MGRKYAPAGYRELGAKLKALRNAAGLTARQVGRKTAWDPTKISRIESGQVHIDVAALCWYLGVLRVPHDVAVPLIDLGRQARNNTGFWITARGERVPDVFSSLLYHESTADHSTIYEPQVIPGLLQTERYARAMIGGNITYTKDDVESNVGIRLGRQWVLDRRDCLFDFYIHEQALRTVVGDRDIMAEQMLALALGGSAPSVSVRVVPGPIGDHPTLLGSFHVFEFEEYEPLVHLEQAAVASFWFEDRDLVAPYRKLALHLADVSASVGESREFIAALADEYDRGSSTHGLHVVEEEHL